MSAFISSLGPVCHHELLKFMDSRESFYKAMKPGVGNADSGLAITDFQDVFPDAPTVIIERDIATTHESLVELGLDGPVDALGWLQSRLDRLTGLRVGFDELDARMPEVCAYLGVSYDPAKHEVFRNLNIVTVNFNSLPGSYSAWRI